MWCRFSATTNQWSQSVEKLVGGDVERERRACRWQRLQRSCITLMQRTDDNVALMATTPDQPANLLVICRTEQNDDWLFTTHLSAGRTSVCVVLILRVRGRHHFCPDVKLNQKTTRHALCLALLSMWISGRQLTHLTHVTHHVSERIT